MRIAFLLNSRVPSNNAHVLQTVRMCEAFAANGHEVTLHYPNRYQSNPDLLDVSIEEYLDVNETFETQSYVYPDMNYFREFVGRECGPQLLFSRAFFTLYVGLRMLWEDADLYYTRSCYIAWILVALGLPTVFETHRTEYGGLGNWLVGRFGSHRNCLSVVTLTDRTATNLQSLGVPSDRIQVLPDGVKLDAYMNPMSKTEARSILSLSTDNFVVGYTGSLGRGKGIHDLVRATADLDVSVLVVGGQQKEAREQFRSFLSESGIDNVEFVGHVPPEEVPIYQWAADLLVLPPRKSVRTESHHPESTSPLKLFEYMAAGRPIVATRLPGIEDVLTDGETALLVEPEDIDGLRTAIARFRADAELATAVATNARESVTRYSWIERAHRILDHVVDGPRRGTLEGNSYD